MTEDAKKVLLEYADGSVFGRMAVRSLLGGSNVRATRAILSLVRAGLVRRHDGGLRLYRLTPLGREIARPR